MSDPNGGADEGRRNRRPAMAGFSAARGAALVAIAVIIGVVLLQAIDDGNDGPVGDGGPASTTTTTTTVPTSTDSSGSSSATTATTAKAAPLPPAQVTVRVLNGSGQAGAAGTLTNTLKAKGYKTLVATDASPRTGTVVYAKAGSDHRVHDAVDLGAERQGAADADPRSGWAGRRLHRRHRELTSRQTRPSPRRCARWAPTRTAPRSSWTSTAP